MRGFQMLHPGKAVLKGVFAVAAMAITVWLGWPIFRSVERLGFIFQSCTALMLLGFVIPNDFDTYQRTITYRGGRVVSTSPWNWVGITTGYEPLVGTGSRLRRIGWTACFIALTAAGLSVITSAGLGGWCRLTSTEYVGTMDETQQDHLWFVADDARWSIEPSDARLVNAVIVGAKAQAGSRLRLQGCTWGRNLVVRDARLDP